jgi:hypothetical protein
MGARQDPSGTRLPFTGAVAGTTDGQRGVRRRGKWKRGH